MLSTRVETSATPIPFPKRLWYAFPEDLEPFIPVSGDPFLAGAILPAMALGEDIVIRAPVSARLLRGLDEFQKLMATWFPRQLKCVQIRPEAEAGLPVSDMPRTTASLFSGGVDSSFILQANLSPHQPDERMQVKHAIFVLGGDIPLSAESRFQSLTRLSTEALQPIGVRLVPCSTNVRSFTEGFVKWDFAHGAALISAGLVLAGLIERLYIASSFSYPNLRPWGSSPLLDHWLSTDPIEVLHIGASYLRQQKIKAIADWEPAQKYLRVCSTVENIERVNCERCDKCLATKAILDAEGNLEKIQTFTNSFRFKDLLRWAVICSPHTNVPRLYLQQAIEAKRWKIIPLAFLVSLSRDFRHLLDRWMSVRMRNRLRRRFFPPSENPFYASNVPEG